MILVCKECGKRYQINPAKLTNKKTKFKCIHCGNLILVPSLPELKNTSFQQSSLNEIRKLKVPPNYQKLLENKKIKIQGVSIRFKLLLIIMSLVAISISIAGFIAIHQSRNALSDQAKEHILKNIHLKSNEYALTFNRIREEAMGVAEYVKKAYNRKKNLNEEISMKILMPWDGKNYGNPETEARLKDEKRVLQQIGLVLKSIVSQNPYLSLGYFATESNLLVFDHENTVDVIEKLDAFVATQRPWYISAKEKKRVIWTEPYVDANTKKLVVTCAVPVFELDTTLLGVVGFDVLLETIQTDILTLDIGYDTYAFLINRAGSVLVRPGMDAKDTRWDTTYRTDNLLTTDNVAFNRIIEKMIKQESGISHYKAKGDTKIISYAPIKAISASMAIVASMDEVIGPAIAIRNIIAVVFVIILIISIGIAIFIGNSIIGPINELTMQANLISMGECNLEVLEIDRKDEIGVLTQSFNRLVISLKMALSRI